MTGLTNIQLLRCSDNGLACKPHIDAGAQARHAYRIEQHKAHLPAATFLVERHDLEQFFGRSRGSVDRQTGAGDEVADPRKLGARDESEACRQLRGHDHAGSDRLAVEPRKARCRFDGVAESMAEIEKGALAAL